MARGLNNRIQNFACIGCCALLAAAGCASSGVKAPELARYRQILDHTRPEVLALSNVQVSSDDPEIERREKIIAERLGAMLSSDLAFSGCFKGYGAPQDVRPDLELAVWMSVNPKKCQDPEGDLNLLECGLVSAIRKCPNADGEPLTNLVFTVMRPKVCKSEWRLLEESLQVASRTILHALHVRFPVVAPVSRRISDSEFLVNGGHGDGLVGKFPAVLVRDSETNKVDLLAYGCLTAGSGRSRFVVSDWVVEDYVEKASQDKLSVIVKQ